MSQMKSYPKRLFTGQLDPFDALWCDMKCGDTTCGERVRVWDQERGGWVRCTASMWYGLPSLKEDRA